MSKNIPTDRPLSDEDRAWLEQWSQHERIQQIDASFPPGSNPAPAEPEEGDETVDVDADIADYVEGLKVQELKDALKAHDIEFDSDDLKDDLQAELAIGLQQKRNAGVTVTIPS